MRYFDASAPVVIGDQKMGDLHFLVRGVREPSPKEAADFAYKYHSNMIIAPGLINVEGVSVVEIDEAAAEEKYKFDDDLYPVFGEAVPEGFDRLAVDDALKKMSELQEEVIWPYEALRYLETLDPDEYPRIDELLQDKEAVAGFIKAYIDNRMNHDSDSGCRRDDPIWHRDDCLEDALETYLDAVAEYSDDDEEDEEDE